MFAMESERIWAWGGTVEEVRLGVGGSWRETKEVGSKKAT